MHKKFTTILILSTVYCLLSTVFSYAQEDVGFIKKMWRKIINGGKVEEKKQTAMPTPEVVKPSGEKSPQKELSKDEMIEIINDNLSIYEDEISLKIPNLVRETDKEGKPIYKFKDKNGEVIDFNALDEETLSSLYNRVVNESTLIRTERINQQLDQIRQQTRPPQIPQPPRPVIPPIQKPPTVFTPPRITPPPQPPQIPDQRR